MDSTTERILQAVLRVQGADGAEELRDDDLAYARRLVQARRLDAEEGGCPDAARHRARALFAQRPAGVWETAARLVLDSWQQLTPAARSLGTERLLRFEGGVAAADVQVDPDPDGAGVTLALAVEGGGDGLAAQVTVAGQAPRSVALDEHGTGRLHVEGRCPSLSLNVRDEDGELLQTPVVSLE